MDTIKKIAEAKNIKDYLHLYLGCEVVVGGTSRVFLTPRRLGMMMLINPKTIKPILRPLSDMTEEEMNTAKNLRKNGGLYENCAELTRYLLSKHFDLFGLIDAGLAIDKTTLK